tara:strand:- start:1066 stop:1257 length:192 start_codon:yes stop_codon:yes gene_type:complete
MKMNETEKAIISKYLLHQIEWREYEAKRIENGNDFAHTVGEMKIANRHISDSNMLRKMLGGLE